MRDTPHDRGHQGPDVGAYHMSIEDQTFLMSALTLLLVSIHIMVEALS